MATEETKLPLREWRRARGYTQQEMAEKLGVSAMTYIRWESKPQKLSIVKAREICIILGITLNDVIFFVEDVTKRVAE